MKIVFDTEACIKNGKEVDVMLYLLSFAAGCKITANTFEKARQRNYLTFNQMHERGRLFPDYVELSKDGEFLIEGMMADSLVGTTTDSEKRFRNLAEKLRELFPAGNKPGYSYPWRDSVTVIADRLKKFVMKYGDYPDDKIIDATKRYVASFNGNYRYMQLLKYFIWKNKVTGEELVRGRLVGEVEKQSQLASWIENDEQEGKISNDWEARLC